MFTNCREAINCPLSSGRLYADTVSLSDSNGAIAIDEMHYGQCKQTKRCMAL